MNNCLAGNVAKSVVTSEKIPKKVANKLGSMLSNYPLKPIETRVTPNNLRTRKHLKNKLKNLKSLPLEAILRSSITEHESYLFMMMGNERGWKSGNLRHVRWDTFSPRWFKKYKASPHNG